MPEREKVITALENCLNIPPCRNCPWDECTITHETDEIPRGLAHAALALLKEQEKQLKEWEKYAPFLKTHGVLKEGDNNA